MVLALPIDLSALAVERQSLHFNRSRSRGRRIANQEAVDRNLRKCPQSNRRASFGGDRRESERKWVKAFPRWPVSARKQLNRKGVTLHRDRCSSFIPDWLRHGEIKTLECTYLRSY